ncbi:YihY/virulence factor BrkB family protein [Streptomyces sp. SL13]|uniref:YihY/virulence factor BrkB family protein n=1 Tax=Streptantibioticus silvisoli TaxID=2705255 RepID=A0AA90KFK5_9ACTN|nr:YihY/virulence factor BrkB family protein [Streptantibioticus silvisoli]MDI5969029.1 YihY/virulence factor BrkB family protein [Streptantibioticus silvisoli]
MTAPHDDDPERTPGPGPQEELSVRSPAGLPARSLKPVVKRTLSEFKQDELTDRAAALTYYGVLAVFPALLALVSVLGLLGRGAIKPLVDNLGSLAPGAVRDLLVSMLDQLERNRGAAGFTLAVGIVLALWSASGYVAAFMRSANVVYDIGEGRPVWKTLPVRFGITAVVVVVLALIAIGVVFTGTLARRAGQVLGIGGTGLTVWNYAKWPVILVLIALVIGLLYWAAPNVRRGFSWVTPGGLLAVFIWLIASALFGLYVANFSSYDKTYGSFAAIIIFLVWLWISNIAILLGLEFNAELERERAIHDGHRPDDEPYAEPRDTRKL